MSDFRVSASRALPVLILADVSGSMNGDRKIDVLNRALDEMIRSFAEEADPRIEIQLGVVTFGGGGAQLHLPLRAAASASAQWSPVAASGHTPLDAALTLAHSILEDREQVTARAFRPTLVLLSDGLPTDAMGRSTENWKEPLNALLQSDRGSKADRFAMAIGADADEEMLRQFVGRPEGRVFHAHEARQIRQFFRLVTMSVTNRSRSVNPNEITPFNFDELEDVDL